MYAKRPSIANEYRKKSSAQQQIVPIHVLDLRYEEAELLLCKDKDETGTHRMTNQMI